MRLQLNNRIHEDTLKVQAITDLVSNVFDEMVAKALETPNADLERTLHDRACFYQVKKVIEAAPRLLWALNLLLKSKDLEASRSFLQNALNTAIGNTSDLGEKGE